MILVLLGTQNNSFHRLLEEIDKLIKDGKIDKPVTLIIVSGNIKKNNNEIKKLA